MPFHDGLASGFLHEVCFAAMRQVGSYFTRLGFTLLALVSIQGCSSITVVRDYRGPVRPLEDVALVTIDPGVEVIVDNGLRLGPNHYIELLPGKHEASILFGTRVQETDRWKITKYIGSIKMQWTVEAGRRYHLQNFVVGAEGSAALLELQDEDMIDTWKKKRGSGIELNPKAP